MTEEKMKNIKYNRYDNIWYSTCAAYVRYQYDKRKNEKYNNIIHTIISGILYVQHM